MIWSAAVCTKIWSPTNIISTLDFLTQHHTCMIWFIPILNCSVKCGYSCDPIPSRKDSCQHSIIPTMMLTYSFELSLWVGEINMLQNTCHCKCLDPVEQCPAGYTRNMVHEYAWGQMCNQGSNIHSRQAWKLYASFQNLPTSEWDRVSQTEPDARLTIAVDGQVERGAYLASQVHHLTYHSSSYAMATEASRESKKGGDSEGI